jgi:hypothetical protein
MMVMLAIRQKKLYIAQLISSTSESKGKAPSILADLMHHRKCTKENRIKHHLFSYY